MYGVLRSIGKGKASAQVLCGIIIISPPPSRFPSNNKVTGCAAAKINEASMRAVAIEAVAENYGSPHICATFDGIWQKCAHTSINGITYAMSADTGKVSDIEIMSKYCQICQLIHSSNISSSRIMKV
jgi:hypothetical protein